MSDPIYAFREDIPGACGICHIQDFNTEDDFDLEELTECGRCGGAGFAIASFIETTSEYHRAQAENSQQAYEILKKKYKVVYESPKRLNNNTGNMFWFCVYDTTKKGEE